MEHMMYMKINMVFRKKNKLVIDQNSIKVGLLPWKALEMITFVLDF